MMNLVLKQNYTFSNIDHEISIFRIENEKYLIRLNNFKNVWEAEFNDYNNMLEKIKNSILKQHSLSLEATIGLDESSVKLSIKHPILHFDDGLFLSKVIKHNDLASDVVIALSKLEIIEKDIERTYPIYQNMLGPCVTHLDVFQNIDVIKNKLKDWLKLPEGSALCGFLNNNNLSETFTV
jgi:hypothetical protein